MWKSTLAVLIAVPVLTNGDCDGCDGSSTTPVDTGADDTGSLDTGDTQPATEDCSGYLAQATAAELAATPRAQTDLEQLAIDMTGGFTADQALYDRLVADTDVIGSAQAHLAGIGYRAGWPGNQLLVGADSATLADMQAGAYIDWDCENDAYGLTSLDVHSSFSLLTFEGTYDIQALAAEYAALPEIDYAEPNHLVGDGSTLCATLDGDVIHYVYDQASGDCPSGCIDHIYTYFTSYTDGTVLLEQQWSNSSTGPAPSWVAEYGSCP